MLLRKILLVKSGFLGQVYRKTTYLKVSEGRHKYQDPLFLALNISEENRISVKYSTMEIIVQVGPFPKFRTLLS